MNDHLIKKLKISVLRTFLGNFIFGGLLIYLCNRIEPFEWYFWLLCLVYPTYSMLKAEKIILEVLKTENDFTIISYAILQGKKELKLNINDIVLLDFFRGFIIKHKTIYGKKDEVYQINAEPWNSIYGQIKELKLAEQELKTLDTERLDFSVPD